MCIVYFWITHQPFTLFIVFFCLANCKHSVGTSQTRQELSHANMVKDFLIQEGIFRIFRENDNVVHFSSRRLNADDS